MKEYKNQSPRLKTQDYGAKGYYFVTICTHNKINFFGEILSVGSDHDPAIKIDDEINIRSDHDPSLRPTRIGYIAKEYWEQIPQHFSFVELEAFAIMPNHIHGILFFNKPKENNWAPNTYTSPIQNLGSIIRQYKGSVKRYANKNNIPFQWQAGYYDKVIRDDITLSKIITYINNNPRNWMKARLK